VAISGNYAYVAAEFAGLHIIDVSSPANPHRMGNYLDAPAPFGVTVSGHYAFVVGTWEGQGSMRVIDVSNPANPQPVGSSDISGWPRNVALLGNYAYVAAETAGLQVIDVSNLSNPLWVGGHNTYGLLVSASALNVLGNHAYVVASDDLHVIDVSNPANPHRVGGYKPSGWANGVTVSGNYAYVATRLEGLRVIDVSNPANPQEVGGYHINGYTYALGISDDVIDVSDPANPQRVGGNTGFSARGRCHQRSRVCQHRPGIGHPAPVHAADRTRMSFGPVRAGQHGIDLSLQGLPGLKVDIERSSDLQHWQSWTSGLLGTGPLELTDSEANTQQFYRGTIR
jgi:hypothetical protein